MSPDHRDSHRKTTGFLSPTSPDSWMFHITREGTSQNVDTPVRLPWLGAFLSSTTVSQETRRTALMVPGPEHVEYRLRWELPESLRLERTPESRSFNGPEHRFEVTFEDGDGSSIDMSVRLEIDSDRVERERYGELREFFHEVGQYFEENLVLKRMG